MKPIVFLGGGGHFRACADVAFDAGRACLGYLAPAASSSYRGIAFLGGDEWLDAAGAREVEFLVAVGQIGSAELRTELYGKLSGRGLSVATLVSPHAAVSPTAQIGAGSAVLAGAVINAAANVGVNCIVNSGAIVEHDSRIGDHAHVATGAIVNGGCRVGSGCLIGSGAILLPGIEVGDDTVIGAATVVTRTLAGGGVWVGIPARRMK